MSSRLFFLTAAVLACVLYTAILPGVTKDQIPEDQSVVLTRRYAEAYLKLAEVQLELRLNANRTSPRAVSAREIDRSRMNVAVAQEQLRLVTAPSTDAIQLHLKHAQEMASVAETDYQRALKAQAAFVGSYNELAMKEFQLKAEVAQLRLAVWSDPGTKVLSLLDHMHWQIERVSEEVLDLQKRVEELELDSTTN